MVNRQDTDWELVVAHNFGRDGSTPSGELLELDDPLALDRLALELPATGTPWIFGPDEPVPTVDVSALFVQKPHDPLRVLA